MGQAHLSGAGTVHQVVSPHHQETIEKRAEFLPDQNVELQMLSEDLVVRLSQEMMKTVPL
jgi:hypothetical protein